jgi:hypothetical protein
MFANGLETSGVSGERPSGFLDPCSLSLEARLQKNDLLGKAEVLPDFLLTSNVRGSYSEVPELEGVLAFIRL